jgi:pyrimidine-nucleoside phosphorylase
VTDPRDVVAAKRDGRKLDPDELRAFVLAYARGELPDYLAAAFLMAAFINGLDAEETLALTRAMVDSGQTLPLDGITRPTVDKHSTGGVADGVTLVFTPIAASLGLAVAKLSGRGLGHTGGSNMSVRRSRRRRTTSSRPTERSTRSGTLPRPCRRSRSSPRA